MCVEYIKAAKQASGQLLLLIGGHLVEFVQPKPDTDDVWHFAFVPVAVGCCHQRAVGQDFDAGIRAVGPFVIIHQSDSILPFAPRDNVFVGADPRDPITLSGAFPRRVSEGDEEPPVRAVAACVSISGESGRQLLWLAPSLAFIV